MIYIVVIMPGPRGPSIGCNIGHWAPKKGSGPPTQPICFGFGFGGGVRLIDLCQFLPSHGGGARSCHDLHCRYSTYMHMCADFSKQDDSYNTTIGQTMTAEAIYMRLIDSNSDYLEGKAD